MMHRSNFSFEPVVFYGKKDKNSFECVSLQNTNVSCKGSHDQKKMCKRLHLREQMLKYSKTAVCELPNDVHKNKKYHRMSHQSLLTQNESG